MYRQIYSFCMLYSFYSEIGELHSKSFQNMEAAFTR